MRLIDADQAIEVILSLGNREYRREKGTIQDALKMLSHEQYTPTVKSGTAEWIDVIEANEIGEPYIAAVRCSNCDCVSCVQTNYCPDCGSNMGELIHYEM